MAIHINTIYESEAFRLLAQGTKDKHAVNIIYSVMCADETHDLFREFERWASERLQEQDDERAEHEARLSEERAAREAERARQYKIGDVSAEVVFKQHDIKNLSDLQLVFDTYEKVLAKTSLQLAKETYAHKETEERLKEELLRVTETNKATIDKQERELSDARYLVREIGYTNGESIGTAIRSLNDRVERLKEELGVLEAQYLVAKEDADGEISSRRYLARMDKVHERLFHDDPTDLRERRDRFAEECLELVQALGMTRFELGKLADYTFARDAGNVEKEISDVFTTLVSLGIVMHMNVFNLGMRGLKRMEREEQVLKIRAKRKTRHGRGPLPGLDLLPTKGEPAKSIIGDNDGPWETTVADFIATPGDVPLPKLFTIERPEGFRWGMYERVHKVKGSSWRGHVCGFYSTPLTPEGYAVASEHEPGNVQVYPVAALARTYWDND